MASSRPRRNSSRTSSPGEAFEREARGLYSDLYALAAPMLRGQKSLGADKISSIARNTREFAAQMEEMPHAATYVDSAATTLEDLADYLRESEVEDIVQDVAETARRNPFLTLGVMVAVGIIVSRMVQPTLRPQRRGQEGTSSQRARRKSSNGSGREAHA